MDSQLFEHLAATDDSHIIAQRKASAVAVKRVRDRFGAFFANADNDLPARIALVEDDLTGIVNDVTEEYGGDPQKIEAAIKHAMGMSPDVAQPYGVAAPSQTSTCPQCGGQMVNGSCPTCGGGGAPGGAGGAGYGGGHTMPQSPSTGPIMAATAAGGFCDKCKNWKSGPKAGCTCDGDDEAADTAVDDHEPGEDGTDAKASSFRVARRPKLCPYHSEVVDVSLGAGDPQAGFNAMASHAWGENHCKGGYEGNCNFRPQMVTQKYWDDKQTEYAERREQRERDRANGDIDPSQLSIDTEPIMHAEPLPDEPGKEGVTDIDGELENAPSAVGSGELAVAASTRTGEALKTESLPTGDNTALGGPSPKIDKGNSGNELGWTLEAIDTQMAGSPNPSTEQDPTDKADYTNKDFLDHTRAVTETVELDSAPDLMDDAGFASGGEEHGPHTKTFGDNGTNPVTRESLSATDFGGTDSERSGNDTRCTCDPKPPLDGGKTCPKCGHIRQDAMPQYKGAVDPDKNPIRELMDEYSGFLMPNEVTAALKAWDVG